jgi:O-antigen/teichoic acid export membrane protein
MFLVNVITMALAFGMPRSIYYFMPRVTNRRKFVLHSYLMINVLGLVALIIIFSGRVTINTLLYNSDMMLVGLCFLAWYVFLSSNGQIYTSVLLSNNKGKTVALTNAMLSILSFVVITTPLFLHMGLRGVFWGVLIRYIVGYVAQGFIALKVTAGNLSEMTHSECFPEQAKYMLPLGLISLVAIFSSSIDRFIITFFMSIEDFALYDRGAMHIPIISTLSITVGAVIMPQLVDCYRNREFEKLRAIWHLSIEKVALIVFPSFIFLFICARQIITLLYTQSFAESIIIFRIYLFILPLGITIFGNIFSVANKNMYLLYMQIGGVLLNAVLCVAMVKAYGNIGPAIATVIMRTALFITSIAAIKYMLHIKVKEVFPWAFLSKLMVCSLISGIIPFFIGNMFDLPKLLVLLICFPTYFLIYYFITDRFSMIKEDDKQTIFKWTGINWLWKQIHI